MIRKALIIHCDATSSGELAGPASDNKNFREFLMSSVGGKWSNEEILSLQNPTLEKVNKVLNGFLSGADYTFTVFTGHGWINTSEDNLQYLELLDQDISIRDLKSDAKRQTLIVDACRGYYSVGPEFKKSFSKLFSESIQVVGSTRALFDNAIMRVESGWTILYAASEDEEATDTDNGGAYLLSLLRVVENWAANDSEFNILPMDVAHNLAKKYLPENFNSIQTPKMQFTKRTKGFFPFAVKLTLL